MPPQIYTGDHSHTNLFTDEFLLYKNLNRHHKVMSVPYNQVLMALTFMKGPKINNWARAAGRTLNEQINQGQPETDEGLWTEFKAGFLSTFVNTTSREDALSQLLTLKMKGTDLDTYISTFDNL